MTENDATPDAVGPQESVPSELSDADVAEALADAALPVLLAVTVAPTGFQIGSNPDTGKVLIQLGTPGGMVEVEMESGDGLDQLADSIKTANSRARSGLVVAKQIDAKKHRPPR